MRILGNKRGDIVLNELLWRVGKIGFTLLVLILLWSWSHDKASGEDIDKKYIVRDTALLADTLTHTVGDIEFVYQPRAADLSLYELTVRNSWTIVNQPGIKSRVFYRYFMDENVKDFDYQNSQKSMITFVRKGDVVAAGSAISTSCVKPAGFAALKSLLLNPSYHDPFPGYENQKFKDSNSQKLIEEAFTVDIGNVAVARGNLVGIAVEATRSASSELPEFDAIIPMSANKGAMISFLIGKDRDLKVNDIAVSYRMQSPASKYLACLISEQLDNDFPEASSVYYAPSYVPEVSSSLSDAAVMVTIANYLPETNTIVDSSSRQKLQQSIYRGVAKYYE